MEDFLFAVIGAATVLGLVFWGIYSLEASACGAKAQQMGVRAQYGLFTDCMILHKGQWIPLKNFRVL